VDNLALKLLYMQEANSDLRSDIKAIMNASHKVQKERTQAEEQKYQQVEFQSTCFLSNVSISFV